MLNEFKALKKLKSVKNITFNGFKNQEVIFNVTNIV